MDELANKSIVGRKRSRRAARIVVRQAFVIRHDSTRRIAESPTPRQRATRVAIHQYARQTRNM